MPTILVGEGPLGPAALPQAPTRNLEAEGQSPGPRATAWASSHKGSLPDTVTTSGNPVRDAPASVLSSSVIPNRKQISVEVKRPHP